ncbi:MAG: sensor histidine kinase [Planctomycetia bacterium]
MSPSVRHDSLMLRLVLPVVGLVLAGVLVNVAFSAWLAARRAAAAARKREQRVAAALAEKRVALSPAVLDALATLTGSHFLVWDPAARRAGATSLPAETLAATDDAALAEAVAAGRIELGGSSYRIGVVRAAGVRPESVLVLTPEKPAVAAAFEMVWPVLAVAAGTLGLLVPLSLRTTRALAGRITAVERHVERIAAGEFGAHLGAGPGGDEVARLAAGVDRLSATLETLRTSLVAGERQRLLGQLAAGFAHELRNAVTGARLAIDVHERRCQGTAPADESLAVAKRQLAILEEEVRGLLALGRPTEAARGPVAIDSLLAAVRDLASPRADHAGVRLECELPTGITLVGRPDSLRAALVNLALNGIEAAGRGGIVRLTCTLAAGRIDLAVEDSGTGPPEAIRTSLAEPFVTGKPEGIGLGLAIVKAVAEDHGGSLAWSRSHGRTRFAISLPAETLEGAVASRPVEPPA